MSWKIIINGELVRQYETREECIDLAVKRCWGRINEAGEFVAFPGVELIEVPAPAPPPANS